jgi:hypothetical protein
LIADSSWIGIATSNMTYITSSLNHNNRKTMKKIVLSLLTLCLSVSLMAASGGSNHPSSTKANPSMGKATPSTEQAEAAPATASKPQAAPIEKVAKAPAASPDLSAKTSPISTKKELRQAVKEMKPNRPEKANKPHGGIVIPILALVFGFLGITIGWFFWPIAILFGLSAIILGAIGMGSNYDGRGLAIAGLILGILTILLPVLIVGLILAVLL